jgi:molecular chaperone DnaK
MGAPPGYPGGSAPPPAHHVTAPMQQQGPQHAPPYGSAPPPMNQSGSNPYGSSQVPTQVPYGAPPYGGSSPPPIFGQYPSSPPGTSSEIPLGGPTPYQQQNVPQAPPPPRNLQYAAPVLVDVTPRGLVVETAGGYTDTIIPRNAKIPCERTRRFATGRDLQTTVRVRVAQGEHGHFPQNTFLGEVELSGLRPAPRGEVVVAVTFEVDADGTLRVRARDVQTGQEARATLQLVGVADESSVVMMINRFAHQPVTGNGPVGPS